MPAFLRWLLRLGPTNPICVRLVQGGSRRSRHLYIRTGYLAVLIAVLLWSLLLNAGRTTLSYRELAAAGASSFQMVSYLQIALICILAPVFMAGAIAQEASPRTWEVLLTTPLSAAQIVLGNLLGRLFFVAALLLSSLPLFAITQYFGGVPGRSIFASYAIALCAALLVGSIAIFLSVSRAAGRRAVFTFYVAVISYLAATWAIDLWLRRQSGGVTVMTATNPFLALEALLNPTAYPRPAPDEVAAMGPIRGFWLGAPVTAWCVGSAGLSVGLVLLSSLTARTGAAGGVPWRRRLFGLGVKGEKVRAPRPVWKNPIAWREAMARSGALPKVVARWAFIALGGLWALAIVAAYHGGVSHEGFRLALLSTVWTELVVITLIAINLSATAVSREREDGTLDLLLTTPITAKMYVGGKLRGLIAYLAPLLAVPLGTLVVASVYVALDGLGRQGGVTVSTLAGTTMVNAPVVLPEAALVAPLVVLPAVAAAVMVGLQWSIKSKGTIGSVVAAVGVIGVIGGILGLCGWQAGREIALVGPALAALNPATAIFTMVDPGRAAETTLAQADGLSRTRIAALSGAAIGATVYISIVYALYSSMVHRFDMTVRQLAGTK
ncbi:MAG: ABC transporter permease subunit [Phycisphaerales bacterium]|nr:ABC transporter permease subunit [Phycisphaerales bacterium]